MKRTSRSSTENKLVSPVSRRSTIRRRPRRDGKGARSQGRPEIQRVVRDLAQLRGRLLRRHRARAPDGGSAGRGSAAEHRPAGRAQPHLQPREEGAAAQSATSSPSISSARSAKRHSRAARPRASNSCSAPASSFPASRRSSKAPRLARTQGQCDLPGRLSALKSWPARTRRSPSRSRRWPRPRPSPSTKPSPRISASTASRSCVKLSTTA